MRAGMTPEQEAQFIAWWQAGWTAEAISARLGVPRGTVSSRASLLREKYGVPLAKRPRGGDYPSRSARQGGQWSPRGAPPDQHQVITGERHREIPDENPRGAPPVRQIEVLPQAAAWMADVETRLSALEARAWQTPAPEHTVEPLARPRVSIYAMRDPRTGDVHYIGQSVNPKARMQFHLYTRGESRVREAWIHELQGLKLKPVLEILEQVDVDLAEERERWWIEHYRGQGAPLVNRNMPVPPPNRRTIGGSAPPLGAPEPRLLRPSPSHRPKFSMRDALREAVQAEAQRRDVDPSKILQLALEAYLHVRTPER